MKIKVENLGGDNAYIDLKKTESHTIELGAGYPNSAQRAIVIHINREEAKDLASALITISESRPAPTSSIGA